jgi:hypothetical protein
MPPGMSPEFMARSFEFRNPPAQITGTVEAPIEAQARELKSEPLRASRRNRHAAYCVSLAFPVCFAVWSIVIGDMRLAMILLLMTLFMAVVGLFTLDGPA